MAKTNKSLTKRVKITRTGKMLKRSSGQNHFNAKARRIKQLAKKGFSEVSEAKHIIRRYPVLTSHN